MEYSTIIYGGSLYVSGIAGVSIIRFWLSQILILGFGVKLRWSPVCGYAPQGVFNIDTN
ncbi:hypothetical protein [Schnuerera sp.]|uniref:hypothetical protein n=1 Tax=Schnuerera sp. TaxID=2794844 RepID=UPI002B570CB2|nr:hypothetical protein [Schnuerera sp.]HSH37030.1 hypothetical protein [Schnuerera sp.]